jgi:predicted N-acetyltransferase YhbS
MSSSLAFRFANEQDIPELQALFSRAFPGRSISASYYRWQFFESPICPCSSVVAEREGQIVAHIGFSGREALINSRRGTVCVKPTAMSDPLVRGSGVYSQLLMWACEQLGVRGAELALSYPNANSHRIHLNHENYADIWQIPALVRRSGRHYSAKHGDFFKDSSQPTFAVCSLGIEQIAEATVREHRFGIMKSGRYLTWRYGRHPNANYYLSEDRRGGRARSALIWKYYPWPDPDRIMVVEWFSESEDTQAAQVFDVVEALAETQGLAVYTWQNVHSKNRHKLLERRGYTLQTPVFYFGAFRLAGPQALGPYEDYRQWHIAMGDVDVF